jgi:hypothetical protein
MLTFRSSGKLKYAAASAVMYEVAMKSRLRHGAIVGSSPAVSSSLDRKYEAASTSMWPSVCAGSSRRSAAGMFGLSMYP